MIKLVEKYPILSLSLFVVVMLGFTVDAIPVTIMEARNFISAREMLTDGNWILTTMNGEARYEKPPLPTWITALFGYIFGMTSVLALRWPALLFVASIGISTYLLSLKLKLEKAHSLINGFIVITSFYVLGITIEGPWDIYAHGFMLMALYQLFTMFQEQETTILRSLLFVVFIAGSVLSKGPVSLYVLFLSFVIAYTVILRPKGNLLHFLKLLSLLIFGIVLGGWWYFHVRVADPETFTAIAARETSNWGSYNVRPFYYYWSFFVQSGLWTIPAFIGLLYPYLKTRVVNLKAYKFTLIWTIIAVVLLSVIPEKKSRYLMPVLIPLAITTGFYIEYLFRELKNLKSKKELIPVYFQFGLIGAIGLFFWASYFVVGNNLEGWSVIRFILSALVVLGIGILIIKNLKSKHIKNVFYLCIALMLSIGLFALPLAKTQVQENFKSVSELSDSNIPLYGWSNVSPEAIYHYGDKIPYIKTKEGVIIPSEKRFNLLTGDDSIEDLSELSQFYDIEFVETYDLNAASEDSKSHRSRLVNKLYKLTRK